MAPPVEFPAAHSALRRPFVWLASALGGGTWLGFERVPPLFALAAAAALFLAAYCATQRSRSPLWLPAALLLGFLRARAIEQPPAPPFSPAAVEHLRAAPRAGLWRPEPGGQSGWIEPFDGAAGEGALLYEPEGPPPPPGAAVVALPGSEVIPWARAPLTRAIGNSASFAGLAPLAVDELVVLERGPRGLEELRASLADLRATVLARVRRVEGPHSEGLLAALAVGARRVLPAARSDLFARTGTSHLLAISGWHVSLFAALLVLPLARRAPRGRLGLFALLASTGLLLLFAGLAGAEKPVWRATLAVILLQAGAWRPRSPHGVLRRPDGLTFLAVAFTGECLLDPVGIRSLSLALTYAATLGLVLGSGPLAARLRPANDRWDELVPGPWSWVRTRLATIAGSVLAASLAAVLATLPLVWNTFGEFAPAGAVLTVLALPPFTALSLLAWLATLWPTALLTAPVELAARLLYLVLEFGDELPGTPLVLPPRPLVGLVLASGLAFLALYRARAHRLAALAWGLLLLPWSPGPAGLELHALDVGHGTATVLRAPGLEALVFDAGSRDRRAVASQALLPLLAQWEVSEAFVVLSHPDQDHASALARLVQRIPLAGWFGATPASGTPRARPADLAGGRAEWEPACPDLGVSLLRGSGQTGNEGSRALLVTWRGSRLLLLGDAEGAGLDGLSIEPGPLRLLLAPHHGADAPGLGALLSRHPPGEVWVSSSSRPAISPELERRGIPWRWTGGEGPLSLRLR
jgi:competence protein ComEC